MVVCRASFRNLAVPASSLIYISSSRRLFRSWGSDLSLKPAFCHWNNRKFRASVKMMFDSSASVGPQAIVNVLQEKDRSGDGDYMSGGWKSNLLLYVANVGDSRVVMSKAGEEHIEFAGTWRVGGVLAMSRAFGNRHLKQYVVAEPEIQVIQYTRILLIFVFLSCRVRMCHYDPNPLHQFYPLLTFSVLPFSSVVLF
ncbi:hypothetical protein GW17_00054031 [Ensete ventricosum]|nr:hypothetical protein GW17_00054031 [Ensete ventricosum]